VLDRRREARSDDAVAQVTYMLVCSVHYRVVTSNGMIVFFLLFLTVYSNNAISNWDKKSDIESDSDM
jgi:hypothetical protein